MGCGRRGPSTPLIRCHSDPAHVARRHVPGNIYLPRGDNIPLYLPQYSSSANWYSSCHLGRVILTRIEDMSWIDVRPSATPQDHGTVYDIGPYKAPLLFCIRPRAPRLVLNIFCPPSLLLVHHQVPDLPSVCFILPSPSQLPLLLHSAPVFYYKRCRPSCMHWKYMVSSWSLPSGVD